MFVKVKQELRRIKNDPVGQRFKKSHTRIRRHGANTGWARIVCIVLAVLMALIGIVLVFIPGPAFVFFILSGALFASQWWTAACVLDRAELKLHAAWKRLKKKRGARRSL
jgi:hypothetical protein